MRKKRKLESGKAVCWDCFVGSTWSQINPFHGIQSGPSGVMAHAGKRESTQRADFTPFEANTKPSCMPLYLLMSPSEPRVKPRPSC